MPASRPPAAFWAVLAVAHVTVTALTWRDLRHRPAGQVRGSKRFWQVFTALNMGDSVLYWLFARRPSP